MVICTSSFWSWLNEKKVHKIKQKRKPASHSFLFIYFFCCCAFTNINLHISNSREGLNGWVSLTGCQTVKLWVGIVGPAANPKHHRLTTWEWHPTIKFLTFCIFNFQELCLIYSIFFWGQWLISLSYTVTNSNSLGLFVMIAKYVSLSVRNIHRNVYHVFCIQNKSYLPVF